MYFCTKLEDPSPSHSIYDLEFSIKWAVIILSSLGTKADLFHALEFADGKNLLVEILKCNLY